MKIRKTQQLIIAKLKTTRDHELLVEIEHKISSRHDESALRAAFEAVADSLRRLHELSGSSQCIR